MANARRGSGRKIDTVQWIGFVNTWSNQGSGSQASTVVSLDDRQRSTIMRVRGELTCYLDGVQAPGTRVQVGVGMQLVPTGTSTTVLRSPITDDTASAWFWYETFTLGYEEMVVDVVDVPGITSFRKTIDGKAMRRTGPDEEIQFVIQNATLATASSVNGTIVGRILLGQS